MTFSSTYRDKLRRIIGGLIGGDSPVAIFGASKASWYIMKVLEANGIAITALCDNDPKKTGQTYHGHPILSPEELCSQYPDAKIFIGTFRDRTAHVIENQLSALGLFAQEQDVYAFLYSYFVDIAKRECDHEAFAKSIDLLSAYYDRDGYSYGLIEGVFISPFVTGVVTQKCNLSCYDCGQRIPFYETPQNFAIEEIVGDIKRYCSAFDLVPEISLHGGEPFLHPEIGRICREVSKIPNLVFINLITNGKIIPPEGTLRDLAISGADLHQSDYGKLSKNQIGVFEAAAAHNIYCDIHFVDPSEQWTRTPAIKPYNRPAKETDRIYRKCVATKICCQIMDGKLYRCPLAAHASAQGLLPLTDADLVRLNDDSVGNDELRNDIRRFLSRTTALPACNFCDPENATLVSPAIQLSKKNRMILANGGQL